MKSKGEVVIYRSSEGKSELQVNLKNETVWLNINQMVNLFHRDKSVISRHISNIYKEKELLKGSTVAKFATVQQEGGREIKRHIEYFNLDVIISVGYRVKSKRGTQFRIWDLVKGYALNEKKLKEQNEKVKELEKSIEVFKRVAERYQLKQDDFTGILKIISDYTYALDILDQYDHKKLEIGEVEKREEYKISYKDSVRMIKDLKKKFGGSDLFGREKDESFRSTVGTLYITFNKKELYPSIEEKAAMLLYLTI